MAKGLRSKAKRANRTYLRKTLFSPNIEKRQKELYNKIMSDLKEKSGNNIVALRNRFSNKSAENGNLKNLDDDIVENNDECELVDDKDFPESIPPHSPDVVSPSVDVATKNIESGSRKGSKPRNNPNKALVWFK